MNRAATVTECRSPQACRPPQTYRPPQARVSAVKPDRFLTGAARIELFLNALRSRYIQQLK